MTPEQGKRVKSRFTFPSIEFRNVNIFADSFCNIFSHITGLCESWFQVHLIWGFERCERWFYHFFSWILPKIRFKFLSIQPTNFNLFWWSFLQCFISYHGTVRTLSSGTSDVSKGAENVKSIYAFFNLLNIAKRR